MFVALILGLALPAASVSQYEPRGPVRTAKMARPLTTNVAVRPGGCYLIGIEVPSESRFSEWIDRRGLRYRIGDGERVNMESEGRFAIADLFCFDKARTITVTIAPTECHGETSHSGLPGLPACEPVRLGEGTLQWQVYEKYTPPPMPPKPKPKRKPSWLELPANLDSDDASLRALRKQADLARGIPRAEPPRPPRPRKSLGESLEEQERRRKSTQSPGTPMRGSGGASDMLR